MTFPRKRVLVFAGLGALCACGAILLVLLSYLSTPGAFENTALWGTGSDYLGTAGVVLQHHRNNCGPAALKMIFDHYGVQCDLSEIERRIGLTPKGSSMLALKQISEIKGLRAEGWNFTLDDFLKSPLPALLLVHGNHYVVVDSASADGYLYVRDPALGRMRIKKETLHAVWNGETLVFRKSEHAASGK